VTAMRSNAAVGERAASKDQASRADTRSATDLHFTKYTSFGNTFIVVDETLTPLADDAQRAAFARWALNGDFGVGGTDNVLYLRRVTGDSDADFVFRIFEHDGSETLSCGNGLLSTAAALQRGYGGSRWGVLTEMPTGDPKLVHVGVDDAPGKTWVNVGWPRATPAELFNRAGPPPTSGIDRVDDLEVPLPRDLPWAAGLPDTVVLSGSLNFTGEPHLVLVSGRGLPSVLEERLYPVVDHGDGHGSRIGLPDTPEMRASNRLVDHIGRHVNEAYRDRFPQGVHLNFARILDSSGLIEYRTYERAIDIETLACGSGAVAMAYVAAEAGLLSGSETTFWPHRCRWYQPDASLSVRRTDSGFVLTGQPRLVCAGLVPRSPESSATLAI
jgi:diaminopimelate epimerase